MKQKAPELHVRLLDEDYAALSDKAAREGISMAEASRRIFHNALTEDAAKRGLDAITTALRKTLRAELDGKFKEIKDLEYKALSTAATAQFLLLRSLRYTMSELEENEFKEIYEAARRDAFNYVYRNGRIPDVELDFTEASESSSPSTNVDYASILTRGFKPDA